MPACLGPHCDKIHPFLVFKTVKFINWPSRAFREPNERDGLMTCDLRNARLFLKKNLDIYLIFSTMKTMKMIRIK